MTSSLRPTTIRLEPPIPLAPVVPILPVDPVKAVSLNDTIQSGSPGLKVTLMILGGFGVSILSIILFVMQFRTR
jgi:hypothetical protein